MLLIDTVAGRISMMMKQGIRDSSKPYADWVGKHTMRLEDLSGQREA